MEGLKDHRDDFDKSWAEAFDGAEMTPPDAVWMKLDAQLAQAEANKNRRAMVWYRWVAAASLLLLLGMGTYVFMSQPTEAPALASEETSNPSAIPQEGVQAQEDAFAKAETTKEETSSTQLAEANTTTANTQGSEGKNTENNSTLQSAGTLAQSSPSSTETKATTNSGREKTPPAGDATAATGVEGSAIAMQSRPAAGNTESLPVLSGTANEATGTDNKSATTSGAPAPAGDVSASTGADGSALAMQATPAATNSTTTATGLNPAIGTTTATDNAAAGLALMEPVSLAYKDVAFEYPEIIHDAYILPIWEPYKKATEIEKYWAGVNLSGGGYAHNVGTGGGLFSAQEDQAFSPTEELSPLNSDGSFRGSVADLGGVDQFASQTGGREDRGGVSFSIGGEAGLRLSRRWSLISGLYYTRNFAESSSRAFLQNDDNTLTPITLETAYTEAALNSEVVLEPNYVDVRSRYEMLGVPLQVGYRLLDKRLSIALQTGVMTNVFLQSKVEAAQDGFGNSFVGVGEEGSPYRRLSWQAMGGLSIGYQLQEQYSLQFTPGFRLPLGRLTNNPGSLDARPRQFNFSLGLRYHLK